MAMTQNYRNLNLGYLFKTSIEENVLKSSTGEEIRVSVSMETDKTDQTNQAYDMIGTFFVSLANVMNSDDIKKESPTAFIFTDAKDTGGLLMGVKYEMIDEHSTFTFIFDQEELKGCRVINFNDCPDFAKIYKCCYSDMHSSIINMPEFISYLSLCVVKTLIKYLDTNVRPDEKIEFVIDDIMSYKMNMTEEEFFNNLTPLVTVSAEIIKDKKVYAIEFSEELKAIAKNNSDINGK